MVLLLNSIPNLGFSLEKNIFFSTKYNEVNIRNGPGTNHLILFKVLQKGYPVKAVGNNENWREIQDYKNRTGWISKSQLSKEKFGILLSNNQDLHILPKKDSKKIAVLNKNVLIKIVSCREKWCKIEIDGITGWLNKYSFWGENN